MIRLIGSEFLRARSRRIVPMMTVGAVFGVLVGVVISTIVSNEAKPTTEQVRRAERAYERDLERCLEGNLYPLEGSVFTTYEEFCAENVQAQGYLSSGLRFFELRSLLVEGTASLVIMLGALLGSSLGGADWTAGTMTTLLTWEPRRARVLLARSIAVAGPIVVITLLAQVWLSIAIAGAVAVKGTFAFTPAGFLTDVAFDIARVSTVAVLFGLIGLAFATVGRSTVAAVGGFLGYLIVVEGFVAAWAFGVAKVALGRAAMVAVTGESMVIHNPRAPRHAPPEQVRFILEPGRAWITVLAWTIAALLLGLAAFRARDVT